MRFRDTCALAALALAAMLSAREADAEPSPVDRATAQSLFDDARKLIDAGRVSEACPKLSESLRLAFGLGTMLRLADCYERNGQSASAWAMFLDAGDEAKKTADPREKVARDRAAGLSAKVSKVVVRLSEPDLPGLVVRRDGEVLGRALYGTAAPVDPGTHAIAVSAPGRRAWTGSVEVPAGGATVPLDVPPLVLESSSSPPSASVSSSSPAVAAPSSVTQSGTRKAVGLVLGGSGAVALGVGAVLWLGAKSKHDDALAQCSSGNGAAGPYSHCGEVARSDNDAAKSRGAVADAVLGVGGALLLVGGILAFTSLGSSETATGLRVAPRIGWRGGALSVEGAL